MSNGTVERSPELDRVMTALEKASDKGDTESAKKLTVLARKIASTSQDASPVSQGVEDVANFDSFTRKGIADVAGAPVDLVTGALNLIPGVDIQDPAFGSESIGSFIGAADRPPETTSERVATQIGANVAALVPFGKAAQLVSHGTGLVARVSKQIFNSIKSHPVITGITEVTAGVGGGIGEGEDRSPTGAVVGSLVGGLAPLGVGKVAIESAKLGGKLIVKVAKKTPLVGSAIELAKQSGFNFSSRSRASKFLRQQVADPETAAKSATEETLGDLNAVIATGERKLAILQQQARELDSVVDDKLLKQISDSIFKLDKEMRALGHGVNPKILREMTKKRVQSIELNLNKKMTDAMDNANAKLRKLPISERKSQESEIVSGELNKVMNAENELVRKEWVKVPKEFVVRFNKTKAKVDKLVDGLTVATEDDLPSVLNKKDLFLNQADDVTTVKEMQGLRSKLLEVQRASRKSGDRNTARIAGEIADEILNDLESATGEATKVGVSQLKIAIASSRLFNSRFNQGIVGDLLGTGKNGAPRIDPTQVIEKSVGRKGSLGAIDLATVLNTPESRLAMERWLSRSYTEFVTSKGKSPFNVSKAGEWLQTNEEVLDHFPALRNQLDDINTAQAHANEVATQTQVKLKRIQDKNIGAASAFLQKDVNEAVANILKTKGTALKNTQELARQARKDPTGEALEGLRGAYIDEVLNAMSVGDYSLQGVQSISGRHLVNFLGKHSNILEEVLDPSQMAKMRKVGSELLKIEKAQADRGALKIELSDAPSFIFSLMGQIFGARVGGSIGGKGAIQSAGLMSKRVKQFINFIALDGGKQLIHDAVIADDGGKLLHALLLNIGNSTPQGLKNISKMNSALNAWLLGSGARVMADINQEIQEDQQKNELKQQTPRGSQTTLQ